MAEDNTGSLLDGMLPETATSTWNTAFFDIYRYSITKSDINRYMFESGREPDKLNDLFFALENLYTDIISKMTAKEEQDTAELYQNLLKLIDTWQAQRSTIQNMEFTSSPRLRALQAQVRHKLIEFKVVLYKILAEHKLDINMQKRDSMSNVMEV